MQDKFENINYEYIQASDIKIISDKSLVDKVQNTYKFFKLCEIYLNNVKDDYGKKKIASLRLAFVQHQLELLLKECFARGINHNLSFCEQ
ncbi:hypothetical protein LY28_01190 [Ruminiclostridium sufflavum DSM 19573]|uniref:Uncharacterized protein n=1 Tax=Ruminiclostridium sufflavum DSM 19573 TaxID=1121337 RepID=A0A318XR68_9FIRM|nr:hypothetical protein [Ruminiclostridium sufflavum]PYG88829.1 hypothetical protein LY28_01190 [Ruminiclostridium sufflavum DSM 19573]